jgi:hypothetical protein
MWEDGGLKGEGVGRVGWKATVHGRMGNWRGEQWRGYLEGCVVEGEGCVVEGEGCVVEGEGCVVEGRRLPGEEGTRGLEVT